jgi:uncharacterized protein (DUF4415 family)
MIARGEDKSDYARANSMTDAEIEAAIASDPDEAGIVWSDEWIKGSPPPPSREAISLRVDPDVLAYFRKDGPGYQTRINAVLRAYMEQIRKKAG